MSPLSSWHRLAMAVAATAALALLTSGCFLKPKKKSAKKIGGASGLILSQVDGVSQIFLDRVGDGDTARLQFKTTQPALCELSFYTQDPSVEPKKDAPKIQACSGEGARNDFTERLEGLRTDTLYEVVITAWTPSTSKSEGESVTVRETPSTSGDGSASDGKLQDLMVARFNIPLMVAEVHRHKLAEPAPLATIRTKLARNTGCRQGVPGNDAAFREASADIGIKSLATRDFAAGTAIPHADQPGRLQLVYPSLNDGLDKWSLLYQSDSKDVAVVARPMSRILNMEMESSDILAFDSPQLAEASEPLVIDKSKPLKFAWTTSPLIDQSYVTITIGRPDYDKAVYCVFPAEKRSASIDPAMLEQLDDGRHVVLAELNTNQLWAKDGWLISVFDWRSARIEK